MAEDFDLIIEQGRAAKNYWTDLWHFRELFYILSWRDIKVRYKQTVIGIAWSIIRPLLTMLIFTIVFGRLAKLPSEGTAPYAILVFAALLPWQFFSNALSECSNSLIGNLYQKYISQGLLFLPVLLLPVLSIFLYHV
jgi:lipopolysaccharide transport system permease protein